MEVGFMVYRVARYWWTNWMAMDPSPTAEAQRLTEPKRTSPAVKMPGTLVSRRYGSRGSFQVSLAWALRSGPARMKPLGSVAIPVGSHWVLGAAPMKMKMLVAGRFSDAIKGYNDVLRLDSDNLVALQGLRDARYGKAMFDGRQALQTKKFTDAIGFFEFALQQKPGDFQATNFLQAAKMGKPK